MKPLVSDDRRLKDKVMSPDARVCVCVCVCLLTQCRCDLLIVMGTSLVVYPFAGLLRE